MEVNVTVPVAHHWVQVGDELAVVEAASLVGVGDSVGSHESASAIMGVE